VGKGGKKAIHFLSWARQSLEFERIGSMKFAFLELAVRIATDNLL